MNARRRKKASRNFVRRVLCLSDLEPALIFSCGHVNGYGCHAQDRHERRVLGVSRWFTDAAQVDALVSQNQPFPLWMPRGGQYHQRYRNRRRRR